MEQVELPGIPPFPIEAAVDGIAQMWFETPDGLVTLPRQPRVKEWFSDGPNFIGRRMRFMADEKIVAAPQRMSGRMPKLMLFFVRAEGSDPDAFRIRIEAALRSLDFQAVSGRGLTVAHIVGSPASASVVGFPMPLVDTVAEIWFADMNAVMPGAGSIARELTTGPSPDIGGARGFATLETVIRTPQEVTNQSKGSQPEQTLRQGSR
jgi:hypothetical protein